MKAKEAAGIIKGIEEVQGALPEDGLLVEEALSMAIKALELFGNSEQLPSAQPERPKGEWVEKPHVYGVAYCSLCDYELHTNDTNFCPNCGADMRGDQDETD